MGIEDELNKFYTEHKEALDQYVMKKAAVENMLFLFDFMKESKKNSPIDKGEVVEFKNFLVNFDGNFKEACGRTKRTGEDRAA